jgi:hypothetical protein
VAAAAAATVTVSVAVGIFKTSMKCSKHLACYDESLVGHQKKGLLSWACQHTPIIKALRRLRPEEHKFETSLSDIVRPWLK